jgi:hypothetical protein
MFRQFPVLKDVKDLSHHDIIVNMAMQKNCLPAGRHDNGAKAGSPIDIVNVAGLTAVLKF